jgi:hypothetical protein
VCEGSAAPRAPRFQEVADVPSLLEGPLSGNEEIGPPPLALRRRRGLLAGPGHRRALPRSAAVGPGCAALRFSVKASAASASYSWR